MFSCFSKSSVNVMPLDGDEVGDLVPAGRKGKKGPGTGRMAYEEPKREPDNTPGRNGLHSAPSPSQGSDSQALADGKQSRNGLHSAPSSKPNAPVGVGKPAAAQKAAEGGSARSGSSHRLAPDLGDFIIERAGGATAADVDEYLEGALGSALVKQLRSPEWAERVRGLESLQGIVMQTSARATSPADRLALFRACVTVLARLLQDKIVPVYLPALQLLTDVYVPNFLAPLPNADLPRAALQHFAGQLVYRAGSSNVRAREESSSAYMHMAHCEHAGPAAVCPFALKPLNNAKSQAAAVSRLELLRTLVNEFGVSASVGLELKAVIHFTVPLCESASERSRDAAFGVLTAAHGAHPEDTMTLLSELNVNVAAMLRLKLSPDSEEEADRPQSLSISGKRLPPLEGMTDGAGDDGAEVVSSQYTPPFAEARARARMTSSELGLRSPPRGHGTKGTGPRSKKNRSPTSQGGGVGAARNSQRQRVRDPMDVSPMDVNDEPRGAEHESEPREMLEEAQSMLVDTRRGRYLFENDDEALMEEILGASA